MSNTDDNLNRPNPTANRSLYANIGGYQTKNGNYLIAHEKNDRCYIWSELAIDLRECR